MAKQEFKRRGALALHLAAWGQEFEQAANEGIAAQVGDVAIVPIVGPIVHGADFFWDNYEGIVARVAAACASGVKTVILKIDSPGGDVAGCFEAAAQIKGTAEAAGVRLVAYVDGMACSAAYALACAAKEIYVPPSGFVGSIGVVNMLAEQSAADRAQGLNVAVVTSGARKADGNPHLPITEDALAAAQAHVTSLAGLFFAWVASNRYLTIDAIAGYEAGIFHGQYAVKAGLANGVTDFQGLLATLASGASAEEAGKAQNDMTLAEAIAGLKQKADGNDEEAAAAKKMLAALDDVKDDKKEDKSSAPPPPAKKDSAESQALAEALARLNALSVKSASLEAEINSQKEAQERSALIASRPDLSHDEKSKGWLATMPLEMLRGVCANAPKALAAPAEATVAATRGASQTQGPRQVMLPPAEKAALDAKFGFGASVPSVRRDGYDMVFSAAGVDESGTK